MGVYNVQGTTKEKFVANAVHVEMQHRHLYIICHVVKATNSVVAYRTKHDIIDNDMVSTLYSLSGFFNPFIFWTIHFLNFGPLIYYRGHFLSLGFLAFLDPPIFYQYNFFLITFV